MINMPQMPEVLKKFLQNLTVDQAGEILYWIDKDRVPPDQPMETEADLLVHDGLVMGEIRDTIFEFHEEAMEQDFIIKLERK